MLPPTLSLRRFFCCCSALEAAATTTTKRNLVFLGSPQVSSSPSRLLFSFLWVLSLASRLIGIYCGAGNSIIHGRFFTVLSFMQETFLSDLRALNPELCVTAAYGNILPNKFLEIPPCGK
ncbi:hypothetical protein BHE74_00036502 [Ensete ventricosum]|uniref:Uncharacterized protein n=1 Tax=Ensete ventricosum TaxID=4639 RepID=A0A427A2V6_ENSVE|nr:hypothetical protein B296_00035696 [Ensete ventricosum]RWW56750.1 hypothetical protein BHE74_00036502 [Ensete ventricosum]